MSHPVCRFFVVLGLAGLLALTARAGDWPQYHGAGHDRSSQETLRLTSWPDSGPSPAWKRPMQQGFSSFTVVGSRAYTLEVRTRDGDEREACVARDTATGDEVWTSVLGPAGYDGGGDAGTADNKGGDGPRSTPTVHGELVFCLDARLGLTCLDAESGDEVWYHDLMEEHKGRNITWQSAASPLVEGDLVFVAGGGAGQSLLAFHAETGEVAWKDFDEKMTHATPIATTLHGVRQILFLVQSGLVAVEPDTGKELWRTEFPYRTSTAASPVVHEDLVYCSAGYGVGAATFRIDKKGTAFSAELVWRKPNKLMNHWSTPVCVDGRLYGMFSFKKYGTGPLQCVDLATGDILWSQDGYGPGNVIRVGKHLVALSDQGEVVLVEADPKEYRELARADLLEGKCWSSPTFSDGALYVRSTTEGLRLVLGGSRSR